MWFLPARGASFRVSIARESERPKTRMADQIRYDLLTQQALRGVVRSVLSDAAKKGLPGEHHFYITFDTKAPGVRISERLLGQYPEEMTIILQHQFWDLEVSDTGFEAGLSFGGIPEKLTVPFEAINGFFDPSVQFGLQFEEVTEGEGTKPTPTLTQDKAASKKPRPVTSARSPAVAAPDKALSVAPAAAAPEPAPDKPAGGGEVVRLDRFRKK
jgi:uncharacterized protein